MANAPPLPGSARTGLISISAISGKSSANCASLARIAITASRSAAGRLRNPFSFLPAQVAASISSASRWLSGASAKVTSFRPSTSTPPDPNITIGPNCGSLTTPTITSCPGGSIRWTCAPSSRAVGRARRARSVIASYPSRTASASRRFSSTPPTSDLWEMSGDATFNTTG